MRVLFSTLPMISITQTTVSVARMFRDEGWDVSYTTSKGMQFYFDKIGFKLIPSGIFSDSSKKMMVAAMEQGVVPETEKNGAHLISDYYAPLMIKELMPVIEKDPPDLIVSGPFDACGGMLGLITGIPVVDVAPAMHFDLTGVWLNGVNRCLKQYGAKPVESCASLGNSYTIDFLPPSWWQGEKFKRVQNSASYCMPHFDVGKGTDDFGWIDGLSKDRPTVMLSLSTTSSIDRPVLEKWLSLIRDMDINLIMASGPTNDPKSFGHQPPNVRIESYVPHTKILPRCDLIISHGGFGTIHACIENALPMILCPLEGFDQPLNADHIKELGWGEHVPRDSLESVDVRKIINGVIADPNYRKNVAKLQKEMTGMPPLRRLISDLAPVLNKRRKAG